MICEYLLRALRPEKQNPALIHQTGQYTLCQYHNEDGMAPERNPISTSESGHLVPLYRDRFVFVTIYRKKRPGQGCRLREAGGNNVVTSEDCRIRSSGFSCIFPIPDNRVSPGIVHMD